MSIRHLQPPEVIAVLVLLSAAAAYLVWAPLYRWRERRKAWAVELCGNCDGPLPENNWYRIVYIDEEEALWRGQKATKYCSKSCMDAALARSKWNGADE